MVLFFVFDTVKLLIMENVTKKALRAARLIDYCPRLCKLLRTFMKNRKEKA